MSESRSRPEARARQLGNRRTAEERKFNADEPENLEGPNRNTRRREKLRSWARYLASIDKRDAEIYRKQREESATKPAPAAQVQGLKVDMSESMAAMRAQIEKNRRQVESMREQCICSITLELFKDPVIASDGHTYERYAIEDWISKGENSPYSTMTNLPLASTVLVPNHAMRAQVHLLHQNM